jgi:hypothetical protein
VCTDDINLLGENVKIVKKTQAHGLEENTEKTKYTFIFCCQTTGQNQLINSFKIWESPTNKSKLHLQSE